MRWQQAFGWGVAIGAGVLVGIRMLSPGSQAGSTPVAQRSAPPPSLTPAPAQARAASDAPRSLTTAVPPASAPAAAQAQADIPPGVTAAQWAALRADMVRRPDGSAELQRLADYLRYQDSLQRFRALRTSSSPDAAELAALARQIEGDLPRHLQRNELSAPEAQLIEIAVLQVLQPDDASRAQALADWRQRVQQAQAPGTAPPAARTADFEREQAQIVAAWQALPPNRRDPAVLQQQLQALRERSFPSPGS